MKTLIVHRERSQLNYLAGILTRLGIAPLCAQSLHDVKEEHLQGEETLALIAFKGEHAEHQFSQYMALKDQFKLFHPIALIDQAHSSQEPLIHKNIPERIQYTKNDREMETAMQRLFKQKGASADAKALWVDIGESDAARFRFEFPASSNIVPAQPLRVSMKGLIIVPHKSHPVNLAQILPGVELKKGELSLSTMKLDIGCTVLTHKGPLSILTFNRLLDYHKRLLSGFIAERTAIFLERTEAGKSEEKQNIKNERKPASQKSEHSITLDARGNVVRRN